MVGRRREAGTGVTAALPYVANSYDVYHTLSATPVNLSPTPTEGGILTANAPRLTSLRADTLSHRRGNLATLVIFFMLLNHPNQKPGGRGGRLAASLSGLFAMPQALLSVLFCCPAPVPPRCRGDSRIARAAVKACRALMRIVRTAHLRRSRFHPTCPILAGGFNPRPPTTGRNGKGSQNSHVARRVPPQ